MWTNAYMDDTQATLRHAYSGASAATIASRALVTAELVDALCASIAAMEAAVEVFCPGQSLLSRPDGLHAQLLLDPNNGGAAGRLVPPFVPVPPDNTEPQQMVPYWLLQLTLRIESLRTNWIVFQYKDDVAHEPLILPVSGGFYREHMVQAHVASDVECTVRMTDAAESVPQLIYEYKRLFGLV
ncbi:hypothetical protein BROUX41_003873 [Berkeleyomyces rouxiae]|uniref:uncharacterized protein n=1 Tax=Berkeleyomyces rouxiae TaxID=2035830 RepID=UPI003B80AD93